MEIARVAVATIRAGGRRAAAAWVRLRWSKRRPYSIARGLIRLAAILAAAAVVLVLLGIVSLRSAVDVFG